MKKLQMLIIGTLLLLGVSAARATSKTENRLDLLAPSDTTQNITQTGSYRITVRGADGGNTNLGTKGGSGASVAATFALQAGDVLTLVTGIAGSNGGGSSDFGGGGGGGSAVILTRGGVSSLLIVAGAGGAGSSFGGGGAGGGGNSAQGTAGGGAGFPPGSAGGGGGFNASGGNGPGGGCGSGGGAGTLSGGGAGGGGAASGGAGGYGFGGGGGGCSGGGAGGGGYGGGNSATNTGTPSSGGSSFVDASGTNVTRTNGTNGGGTGQNGSVSVVFLPPTAASVSVRGRILSSQGRGIGKARVTLTDLSGATKTVVSNPFGYYRFNDVGAGQTVIVTVIAKRYQFAPQVLTVTEEINDLNFAPLE